MLLSFSCHVACKQTCSTFENILKTISFESNTFGKQLQHKMHRLSLSFWSWGLGLLGCSVLCGSVEQGVAGTWSSRNRSGPGTDLQVGRGGGTGSESRSCRWLIAASMLHMPEGHGSWRLCLCVCVKEKTQRMGMNKCRKIGFTCTKELWFLCDSLGVGLFPLTGCREYRVAQRS